MRIAFCLPLMLVLCACGRDDTDATTTSSAQTGTTAQTHTQTQAEVEASSASFVNGQAVYVQSCLLCHQHDGGGVPNMQPALVGSEIVAGNAEALIELTLRGIGGTPPSLPASGEYAMVMPGAMHLTDQQIADLLTYIRQEYDNVGPVSAKEVAAVRAEVE